MKYGFWDTGNTRAFGIQGCRPTVWSEVSQYLTTGFIISSTWSGQPFLLGSEGNSNTVFLETSSVKYYLIFFSLEFPGGSSYT